VNGRDVFFAGAMALGATYTARESVMSFALHGQQVVGAFDASRRGRRALVGLVALSLVVGYIVSCASSLACYYRNASPITSRVQTLINPSPMESLPRRDITDPLARWADGRGATKAHDPWVHVGIGAVVTAALYVLTLRYAGWPLMPLGYLVHGYWYMQVAWFSVFLGWLAKALLVRFGGASLYQAARPAAIGMIFGEAFAAGAWLVVNLLLAAAGYDYQRTAFLPS
jgi:hypothetical protein